MDFELSKEQRDIQKAAKEFATAEFDKDYMLDLDLNHAFPRELVEKASQLGFICLDFPEEYGGGGYGLLEKSLVLEEFCQVGGGIGTTVGTCQFAAKLLLRSGSEAQKKRYLPAVCHGEGLPVAGAFTEPDRGSDIVTSPLSVKAVADGADYVINGTKTFISNAAMASFAVVLCQTDETANPPYQGQSAIIVEKPAEQPGISITDFNKLGWRSCPTTQLSFVEVRVPQENLVGEKNRGFYHTIGFLDEFRVEIGAASTGTAQGAFERALDYAKTREAFGHKIGAFQAIAHKLADMATKIESARLLVYEAACQFDRQGKIDPKLSSMAKWYPARVAVEVADEAVEILGGHGYMAENEVERFYRDSRAYELIEGTREIQKNTIARYLLGKLE